LEKKRKARKKKAATRINQVLLKRHVCLWLDWMARKKKNRWCEPNTHNGKSQVYGRPTNSRVIAGCNGLVTLQLTNMLFL
jgi:hypothetical protein